MIKRIDVIENTAIHNDVDELSEVAQCIFNQLFFVEVLRIHKLSNKETVYVVYKYRLKDALIIERKDNCLSICDFTNDHYQDTETVAEIHVSDNLSEAMQLFASYVHCDY